MVRWPIHPVRTCACTSLAAKPSSGGGQEEDHYGRTIRGLDQDAQFPHVRAAPPFHVPPTLCRPVWLCRGELGPGCARPPACDTCAYPQTNARNNGGGSALPNLHVARMLDILFDCHEALSALTAAVRAFAGPNKDRASWNGPLLRIDVLWCGVGVAAHHRQLGLGAPLAARRASKCLGGAGDCLLHHLAHRDGEWQSTPAHAR
jgi:hypothetical protein